MTVTAIIPAAGSGTRMGNSRKQYMVLGERPILEWTLLAVGTEKTIKEIILVAPPDDVEKLSEKYLEQKGFPKVASIIAGGSTRGESVYNGVMKAASDYVLVHDAARPFVTQSLLKRTIDAAMDCGAATAAIPAIDTAKMKEGNYLGNLVDRSTLLLIQTPQVFKRSEILRAYEVLNGKHSLYTDETTLLQQAGFNVRWVHGDAFNMKITTPEDFPLAESLITLTKSNLRN